MKDRIKTTGKIVAAVWHHGTNKLKIYLGNRTPRQRLIIILSLFLLLAVIDLWMIASSISGGNTLPEIEHIEPLKP